MVGEELLPQFLPFEHVEGSDGGPDRFGAPLGFQVLPEFALLGSSCSKYFWNVPRLVTTPSPNSA